MVSGKEKDFKVRGTYRLRQEGRKNEWVAIDSKGHGVKLGTNDLKQAKKRAGLAIKKMEKTRDGGKLFSVWSREHIQCKKIILSPYH